MMFHVKRPVDPHMRVAALVADTWAHQSSDEYRSDRAIRCSPSGPHRTVGAGALPAAPQKRSRPRVAISALVGDRRSARADQRRPARRSRSVRPDRGTRLAEHVSRGTASRNASVRRRSGSEFHARRRGLVQLTGTPRTGPQPGGAAREPGAWSLGVEEDSRQAQARPGHNTSISRLQPTRRGVRGSPTLKIGQVCRHAVDVAAGIRVAIGNTPSSGPWGRCSRARGASVAPLRRRRTRRTAVNRIVDVSPRCST